MQSSHSPVLPQKRKSPDDAGSSAPQLPPGSQAVTQTIKGEYETGRVICEVCGEGVSFRDEPSGGFTLKHWDAHRQQCGSTATQASPPEPVIYTPESTAEALANPPVKRRRAKRTEEERIDYLRTDPYVARFEAYRVLCACCDKWIRLRPNSTYCSIPWDAHRKSCLSRKITNKNVYALEERNTLFSKDPDVRKFDAERVLCNMCDSWVAISPEDHLMAVQKWLSHRSLCQKVTTGVMTPEGAAQTTAEMAKSGGSPPADSHRATKSDVVLPPTKQQLRLASLPLPPHPRPPPSVSTVKLPPLAPAPPSSSSKALTSSKASQPPGSPSSFKDLTPTNFPPAQESRRRNAEQRAATLRADSLVGEVEPNRVFCSLCQKWVQLRQDSSYCAYPWLQHRGKCLARHQRRVEKAAEVAEFRARRIESHGHVSDEGGELEDELDSEDGRDHPLREEHRKANARARATAHSETLRMKAGRQRDLSIDGDGDSSMRDGTSQSSPRPSKRSISFDLADLSSPAGRRIFIFAAVDHLFTTTYEDTDDMTISSLLTYLNAAMPPDKHEDFDTGEVIRAAAALQERGDVVFQGDVLRQVE